MAETLVLFNPLATASHWSVIKQALPTTQFLNSSVLEAYSDTENAYEGTADSKKSIVMFDSVLRAGSKYRVPPYTNATNVRVSLTLTSSLAVVVGANIRMRPITAPYSASQTWNTFMATPPTMGADVLVISLGGFTPVSVQCVADTGLSPNVLFDNVVPMIDIADGNSVYGFVLDIAPEVGGAFGGSPGISSISASLSGNFATGAGKIYAMRN